LVKKKKRKKKLYTSYELSTFNNKLDIFRFPIIEWDFRWQRPQQFLIQFAKAGYRCFYLSLNTHVIENKQATYEEISAATEIRKLSENVWWGRLCSYQQLNVYQDRIEHELDIKYLVWSIESIKEKFDIDYTLSIVDLPFWTSLVTKMKNNKIIYDCLDEHAGFSNVSESMLTNEPLLIEKSDMVITSAQLLFEKVKKQKESTYLIRNAGEYEYFSREPDHLAPELKDIKGPIIGYFGAIADWFDAQIVEELARKNSEWHFCLIGNYYYCNVETLSQLENVSLLGEKTYQELPSYLYGFDVCIIPFKVTPLTLATNPVKVYEYLSSGKPVVATRLPELEMMEGIIELASSTEEFEVGIQNSLSNNTKDLIQHRKDYAMMHTWEERFQTLKGLINNNLFPKISIIIVTFNNWGYTKQCLESIFMHTNYPNLEIIIIDNSSSDETTYELAKINHPNLKVHYSSTNLGFAMANSLGCSMSSGKYIVLLNNDTIVQEEWLERLLTPLIENDSLGIVGPMSNNVGNDQMLDHFIEDPRYGADKVWLANFYSFYHGRLRFTELLGFFCVAMKREVFENVGQLDSGYQVGMFEDDDYCERVLNAGYQLAIVEDAFVYHHGSASFKKLPQSEYNRIFETNKRYFENKWNKKWELPKSPASIFHLVSDSIKTAEIINNSKQNKILILGSKHWVMDKTLWQEIAKSYISDHNLVLTYALSYLGSDIHGIRKIGPSCYFTNRIDWLKEAKFDQIIYCGETNVYHNIRAKEIIIEKSCYEEETVLHLKEQLQIQFPESIILGLSNK
jgi:O-antigen biosynthesis protein